MDKFVIRSSKPLQLSSERQPGWMLKQSKIESLKGVVKIKEIEKYAAILKSSKDNRQILVILGELAKKMPSTDVLKETGIGKAVKKLCKSDDLEVASRAEDVYEQWKAHVEKIASRKPIEVSSDEQTFEKRQKACDLISKHLADDDISGRIEHEIYKMSGQLLNQEYRKHVRQLALALANRESLREKFLKEKVKFKEHLKEFFCAKSKHQ